jgi:cyclic pyranopterin phosphate synthase
MVDVSGKPIQLRTAVAEGWIRLADSTLELILQDDIAKGNVLAVVEVAGVQAAKRTSELIPLCHPLRLSKIEVKAEITQEGVKVSGYVACVDRTGAEMEALTAVSVGLLTVYDMCKAVDKDMRIEGIHLLEKQKHDI